MKYTIITLASAVALLAAGAAGILATSVTVSTPAVAAPSCVPWMWQSPGKWWKSCVNDDGKMECFEATDKDGANSTKVDCK